MIFIYTGVYVAEVKVRLIDANVAGKILESSRIGSF
jgi:hypothetical protein